MKICLTNTCMGSAPCNPSRDLKVRRYGDFQGNDIRSALDFQSSDRNHARKGLGPAVGPRSGNRGDGGLGLGVLGAPVAGRPCLRPEQDHEEGGAFLAFVAQRFLL